MSNHKPAHQPPDPTASPDALVLPLDTLNRTLLPLVVGKAAQLGTLIGAGFAVPTGFCVTTNAYARVAASAELDPPLGVLSTVLPTDTARLAELAAVAGVSWSMPKLLASCSRPIRSLATYGHRRVLST
jgi:phosphoenolpyruvate synthase/pyruvate phosphate dikinase